MAVMLYQIMKESFHLPIAFSTLMKIAKRNTSIIY